MLKIKQGTGKARVGGLGTEIVLAIFIVKDIYEKHGFECILTEGTGGIHGYSSEHYKGDAADFRTSNIRPKEKINLIAGQIKDCLGEDYDVVVEETHLHVEFDPK